MQLIFVLRAIQVFKTITSLDLIKAHGHDMISIRMLKLCGGSIYKPLRLILSVCVDQGFFPFVLEKNQRCPY